MYFGKKHIGTEREGGEGERETESERQTDRQTGRQRVAVVVTWCSTPSQPLRLYQGEEREKEREKRQADRQTEKKKKKKKKKKKQ